MCFAEPIRRLGDRERARLDPSFDGQPAVANIDRSENLPWKVLAGLADQSWIQERGRTDRDAVGAGDKRRAYSLDCAESAANVDCASHRPANLRDRLDISRCAGNRAIKIDYVDKFRPRLLEPTRGLARIRAIDGRAFHVAVEQAHDLATLEVNRGNNG